MRTARCRPGSPYQRWAYGVDGRLYHPHARACLGLLAGGVGGARGGGGGVPHMAACLGLARQRWQWHRQAPKSLARTPV